MSARREGFGLIEVIIAMLILTVGVLAMGASTGYILSQVRASEMRSDRMVAVRVVSERVRAMEWDDLQADCHSQVFTVAPYTVSCDVEISSVNLATIRLVSEGPGYSGGRIEDNVQETLVMKFARPVQ